MITTHQRSAQITSANVLDALANYFKSKGAVSSTWRNKVDDIRGQTQ